MNAMPPVATSTLNLKFSVEFTNLLLFATKRESKIPRVRKTAWLTIPAYNYSNIVDIPPRSKPSSLAYTWYGNS